MKAILILPDTQQLQQVDIDHQQLLLEVRQRLGLMSQNEGVIPHLIAPGIVLWLHDRGLLMPKPALWKLEESIYAGAGLLHGINPWSAQFTDGPLLETVQEKTTWSPGLKLAGIQESVRVVQGPNGYAPVVDRSPQFEAVQPPAAEPQEAPSEAVAKPVQLWTVYRNGEGGFRAIKYEISAAGHSVIDDPVEADDLEVLYALMEVDADLGDTVHPRDSRDAPSIVETWRLAPR